MPLYTRWLSLESGLQCSDKLSDKEFCVPYHMGKSHKLHFSLSDTHYTQPLQLLQVDIWGLAPTVSIGNKYYISFVDAYSQFTWIYFLVAKSDTTKISTMFHVFVEKQLNHMIKAVQTDNVGEFCGSFHSYLISNGIHHRYTCPHTSQ